MSRRWTRSGRTGVVAVVVLCLPLCLPAPTAEAADLSREETKWAKACLKRLGAEGASVRKGAQRALATLGTDAVPILADAWWNAHEETEAARLEPVFSKIGRKAVLKRLKRMQADARGAEAKMLDALIAVLGEETPPADEAVPEVGAPNVREEEKWGKECKQRLGANSPRVRAGAERALASLGIDAMPGLIDLWVKSRSRVEQAAIKRVFLEVGRDAIVKRLLQFREGARGKEAKRLDALLEELGASSAPGSAPEFHALTPSARLDWRRIPFGAEHAVHKRMPKALGLGRYKARREGPVLAVDVDGDGKPETRLDPGTATTHRFRVQDEVRPVLLYEKVGEWYACSASVLTGRVGASVHEVSIEVLDADLDGSFSGTGDYLRIEDGPFQPYRKGGTLFRGEDRVRYELVSKDGTISLRVEVLERTRGIDPRAFDGLLALNRFRALHALAPLECDASRCDGCRKHAAYLAANLRRRAGEDLGGTPHDETPGRPGYTKEGAQAGSSSNIGNGADLRHSVERLGKTMLHRAAWLCDATVKVGLGTSSGGGGWSVIWTGSGRADGEEPVFVPTPGAHHVPQAGVAEWPSPEGVPDAYESRIGYPVSVTYRPLDFENVSLVLMMEDGTTPVPGHTFTPAQPISGQFPQNGGSAFFLPDEPLGLDSRYWAIFTAKKGGKPVRFAWIFFVD